MISTNQTNSNIRGMKTPLVPLRTKDLFNITTEKSSFFSLREKEF